MAATTATPTWRASTGMRWAGQIATAVSAFSAIRRGSRRLGTLSQLRDAQLHRPGARLQPGDDFGDFEPRMDRALGAVLMGAGETEIGENAVAHELCDEAVVVRDRATCAEGPLATGKHELVRSA
jgi:hypothetical protein